MKRWFPNAGLAVATLASSALEVVLDTSALGIGGGWLAKLTEVLKLGCKVGAGLGINLWSSGIERIDAQLNHDLEAASGRAITNVINEFTAERPNLAAELSKLRQVVTAAHDPAILTKEGPAELPEFSATEFVADPQGFLGREALDAQRWTDYLRDLARRHGLRIRDFSSTLAALGERLAERHAEALYGELKSAAGESAFRGVMLRQSHAILEQLAALLQGQEKLLAERAEWESLLRQIRTGLHTRVEAAVAKVGAHDAEAEIARAIRGLLPRVEQRLDEVLNLLHSLVEQVDSLQKGVSSLSRETRAADAARRRLLWVAGALLLGVGGMIYAVGTHAGGLTPSAAANLEALTISYVRPDVPESEATGVLGITSARAEVADALQFRVRFDAPTRVHLIVLDTDGEVEPKWPQTTVEVPPPSRDLVYPVELGHAFVPTSHGALGVVVVWGSDLPSFDQWRDELGGLSWERLQTKFMWEFDGKRIAVPEKLQRGTEAPIADIPPKFRELCERLRRQTRWSARAYLIPVIEKR